MRTQKQPDSMRTWGFTTVGVDKPTKAGIILLAGGQEIGHYMRDLIQRELTARDMEPELPGQELSELVVRHGVELTMDDLNLIQRVATRIAQRLGVTIDRAKWREDFLRKMLPGQDASGKPE